MPFVSNYTIYQQLDFIVRILLACLCGGVIGYERTKRYKEAGLRTHIIVCCGAALIMIVSIYGFEGLSGLTGVRAGDPARLAAQAVTGISFMGAGVIYKNGTSIHGLTTAAGLWTTALIGLSIGAGMFAVGIFTTVLVAALQLIMHRRPISGDAQITYSLKFIAKDAAGLEKDLSEQLLQWHARISDTKMYENEKGEVEYEIHFTSERVLSYEEIHRFFKQHQEVKGVATRDSGVQ